MTEAAGRFQDLALRPDLLRGVEAAGFTACTPIQAATLPLLLEGRDIAGQAQTGTGKTAAFLLAAMQHILAEENRPARDLRPRGLIISPTRELAVQIYKDAEHLGLYTDLSFMLAHGGVDYAPQLDALHRGIDLLIGTPGRLIDLHHRGSLQLNGIRTMVLDEADRMFDLGFIRDIRFLLRRMPPPRQRLNMLFSATLPCRAVELAHEHMDEPEVIRLCPEQLTVDTVTQQLYHITREEKPALLVGLLRSCDARRTLIFVNTRHRAEHIQDILLVNGFDAAVLSGNIPQHKRLQIFRRFSAGELDTLVATDLAARGLHVDDISHVINYDLPFSGNDYVHRIGRTARAGANGDAYSLACDEYVYSLPEIENYLGHKIPVSKVTPELLVKIEMVRPRRRKTTGRPQSGARRPAQRPGNGRRRT